MPMNLPVRVVIAADNGIFREALRLVLESDSSIVVIGFAADGHEAFDQTERLEADVLLFDLDMHRGGGLNVLACQRRHADVHAIALTRAIAPAEVVVALQFGVRGILLQDASSATLLECVNAVARGAYWVRGDQMHGLLEATVLPCQPATPSQSLTRRELDVIAQVSDGASNGEVALVLAISEQTVKNHLSHIFDKLGVSNRLELALHAFHHQLLAPGAGRTT